ncbi:DUF1439 domain-containing protein [Glaciecola siphonariae]|uniref:DUF1439 domain-containing protein n=1 Tax=Glaciecola siphonariae TaxID=521012 RepID=A0ABV9LVU2_9ALTE
MFNQKNVQLMLLVFIVMLLNACSATKSLSVYSMSNADLESALRSQLPKLSDELSLMGLPVKFEVDEIDVNIGPNQSESVELSFDSSASIGAFGVSYGVGLDLKVEGSPYYDGEKKAIFVRNVRLLDSRIDAGGYQGNLGLLDDRAMELVNAFLSVTPVYTLNLDDPKVAFISKVPLDMKVSEGALMVVPRF